MRIKVIITSLAFLYFALISTIGNSQVFVQLELYDDPIALKFGTGDKLIYKTKNIPDRWQNDRIQKVDYENNVIVFNRGYEHLEDITHLKIEKPFVSQLGERLMQFSVAWLLYGGIASLISGDDWDFGWDTFGIGAGAFISGIAIKEFGGAKTYNLTKRERLRIVDIGWPQPRQ